MAEARSDAELATELESLSLELTQRLDRKAELARDDPVASDEIFIEAGNLYAVLQAASERMRDLRERLDRSARGESPNRA
ncbi:MAG: hypothetical protein QOE13_1586 [Gaiellaceae bacterium]|jgi:hypothetical protein|nr:hypothetical protein [Gaiellaceae bacterium]